MSTKSFALITAMAAGFLGAAAPTAALAGDAPKVRCDGGNSCKGKSACSTATNGCAGQNGCKGKGWVMVTEKDCKAAHGKVATEKK